MLNINDNELVDIGFCVKSKCEFCKKNYIIKRGNVSVKFDTKIRLRCEKGVYEILVVETVTEQQYNRGYYDFKFDILEFDYCDNVVIDCPTYSAQIAWEHRNTHLEGFFGLRNEDFEQNWRRGKCDNG